MQKKRTKQNEQKIQIIKEKEKKERKITSDERKKR